MHYAPGGVGSLTPTLRLRCRSGVFHRRAAPPRSPLRARPCSWSSSSLSYVLQAVPLPGVGRQPTLRLALLPEVRCIRFVAPYMFSGRGLGLPPRRYSFSSFRSYSLSITLLRFLCLPGPPGGFQVATTGETKSTIGKVFSIHMAVWEITNDIHDVARSRPWFLLSENAESQQRTARVPQGHSGSAQGAFRGLVFCLASSCGFLLCFLPLLASLGCCVFGAVRACFGFGFRVSFPTALLLGELMTRIETAPQLMEIASRLLIKGRRPTRAFSSPRHLG